MPERWRPPSAELDDSWDVLHEGVPAWLTAALWEWCRGFLMYRGNYIDSRLVDIEVALRIPLDRSNGRLSASQDLVARMATSDSTFLDVIAYILAHHAGTLEVAELNRILTQGGSVWEAVSDPNSMRHVLQRRVDPTVTELAQTTSSEAGRAGTLLAKAWRWAYAKDANAGLAYREAVRAVEAAGKPIISPANAATSVGTMIADIRNAPRKWRIVLQPTGKVVAMDAFRGMLELLWKSQLDRHGTPDDEVPIDVSIEEAQAAVHLAATLVQWFSSGAIERVEG